MKEWTASKEAFPDGSEVVFQETGMPVVAHSKWWCNETTYARRNGGKYEFYIDDQTGLVLD